MPQRDHRAKIVIYVYALRVYMRDIDTFIK